METLERVRKTDYAGKGVNKGRSWYLIKRLPCAGIQIDFIPPNNPIQINQSTMSKNFGSGNRLLQNLGIYHRWRRRQGIGRSAYHDCAKGDVAKREGVEGVFEDGASGEEF